MIALFGMLSLTEKLKKKKEDVNPCKLKILDLSVNQLQVGILHSFRQFLEFNKELCALSFSGFERINDRAFSSICQSLMKNQGLQTIDFGNLCQWQIDYLVDVNKRRDQEHQILMVPPQRIIAPSQSMIDASKDDIDIMIKD